MTKFMPGAAGELAEEYPDVWKAYAALGKATAECPPLTGILGHDVRLIPPA